MSTFTSNEKSFFTLSNGQLVDAGRLERDIKKICHYVQYVTIVVKDGKSVVAVIFPDKKLFTTPDYEKTPEEGCFCPRNISELGRCLYGCLQLINQKLLPAHAAIEAAMIIGSELCIEDGTLTPSLDTHPGNIIRKYKDHLDELYGHKVIVKEEVFSMRF